MIKRVYDSLAVQSFRDFEWLVIDDGSDDQTDQVIREFTDSSSFPIRYFYRPNRGKAASINEALSLAKGEFFLVFDSDDWCVPDAIESFLNSWEKLGSRERDYCAVSALKCDVDGNVIGEDYGRMALLGETYVDRFNKRIRGDKWEFIRTDVHRAHRYQLAPDERYQAPEYAWLGMGASYKTIFLNKVLSVVEYQSDGISKNNIRHRAGSAESTVTFYRRAYQLADSIGMKLRMAVNAARFSMHGRRQMNSLPLWPVSVPLGFGAYLMDRVRIRRATSSRPVGHRPG